MDRRVTPPKLVISPTWGFPPPCKQALSEFILSHQSITVLIHSQQFACTNRLIFGNGRYSVFFLLNMPTNPIILQNWIFASHFSIKKRGYHAVSASSYMYDKVWYILLYDDKITSNWPVLTWGLINCPYSKCKSWIVGIQLTFFAEESYKLAGEYINANDVISFCPYFMSNQ